MKTRLESGKAQKFKDTSAMTQIHALIFGGCLVHIPLRRTVADGVKVTTKRYRALSAIHSFGEMFQFIEVLRGEKTIPQELRPLAAMSPDLAAVPEAQNFRNIDIVLVEPASPVEMRFRDIEVNRWGLKSFLGEVVPNPSRDFKVHLNEWIKGLTERNDTARSDAAAGLLNHLHQNTEKAELARSVVSETRSSQTDIAAGFGKIRQLIDRPMAAVSYVFRYMPDGRPISWPPGFRKEIYEGARKWGLPIFDPADVVMKFGAERAMNDKLSHYSDEFMPVIGRALIEFTQDVLSKSTGSRIGSSQPLQTAQPPLSNS